MARAKGLLRQTDRTHGRDTEEGGGRRLPDTTVDVPALYRKDPSKNVLSIGA